MSLLFALPFSIKSFPYSNLEFYNFKSYSSKSRISSEGGKEEIKVFELQDDSINFEMLEFGQSPLYMKDDKRLDVVVGTKKDFYEDLIGKNSPEIDERVYKLKRENFQRAISLYRFKVLCWHLGYLQDYLDQARYHIKRLGINEGIEKILQEVSGFGYEVQLVLAISAKLTVKYQVKAQTYRYLNLTMEEVDEIEEVRKLRRDINVAYTYLCNTERYKNFSKTERDTALNQRDVDLNKVSTTLYKICNMGASYLTSSARMSLKVKTDETPESVLNKLRCSELNKYRQNKESYELPKLGS